MKKKKTSINPLIIFAVIAIFLVLYFVFVPSKINQEEKQEVVPSYELPTFSEKTKDFKSIEKITPITITESFDTILAKINKCYPIESNFSANLSFKQSDNNSSFSIPMSIGTGEKRLVFMETNLRLRMADVIASLFEATTHYHHVQRQLHLYESLEKRSQTRVKQGVVAIIDEQVLYLDKVISAQLKLDTLLVQANAARVGLLSLCKEGTGQDLDDYIKSLILE
ncbi:hypothetical protein [Candidatus Albibeggiatoa sp. nov. BB20]|uniref:hypothetical protein n=1 Tax=Candidatus Albibeggiatoa sp. nov. BB20 TaxID=3162723 RepID=UPI00336594B9